MVESSGELGRGRMAGGAVDVDVDFIGVGCNRVVGAVAWGPCNLVAFAAHHAVAIFDPKVHWVVCVSSCLQLCCL
jgi:hypothetical protein